MRTLKILPFKKNLLLVWAHLVWVGWAHLLKIIWKIFEGYHWNSSGTSGKEWKKCVSNNFEKLSVPYKI
jgi:hypothetical protein